MSPSRPPRRPEGQLGVSRRLPTCRRTQVCKCRSKCGFLRPRPSLTRLGHHFFCCSTLAFLQCLTPFIHFLQRLYLFFFFKAYGIYLIYLFIYFWLCWVFVSVRGLSLVVASRGLSLSRPLLLRSTGSRRTGSVVVAHGPSCSAACGIFPDQGSNPCPLH